jgi:8-oxo-dGTP diphosphatase
MIEVVAGIIVQGGRILLAQRPATKDFPFTWECPGGKVERGESHHEALGRELGEELGIKLVDVGQHPACNREFDLADRPDGATSVRVSFYRVRDFLGTPASYESQGFGWFTAPEMRRLSLAPANLRAIEAIVSEMQR